MTLFQNETFQTSGTRLDGLACVDHTVLGLYERCRDLTSGSSGRYVILHRINIICIKTNSSVGVHSTFQE